MLPEPMLQTEWILEGQVDAGTCRLITLQEGCMSVIQSRDFKAGQRPKIFGSSTKTFRNSDTF